MNYLSLALLIVSADVWGQSLSLKPFDIAINSSFRGLSVVDDSVVWASGSQGWVGKSLDGGKHWNFKQVPRHEKSEFRSLYALNKNSAIVANSGSPANILITKDGGETWKTVYTNLHKDAFFDGIDFWNSSNGIIYGDPIDGRMLLLSTNDGGNSWNEIPEKQRPQLNEGEASFAASGTGIRCYDQTRLLISTGGNVSRLFTTSNLGKSWKIYSPPIIQGESSTGIFSFAFRDARNGIVAGGDYVRDTLAIQHIFVTKDGGKTWAQPVTPTRGYRECIEYISNTVVLAAGPKGIDISNNNGLDWAPLSDEQGYHVIRKARHGNLVILAGNKKLAQVSIK